MLMNYWFAVALSAQTTDKKVNEVTPKLFGQLPIQKNGSLEEPEIKELIKEIGFVLAPKPKSKKSVGQSTSGKGKRRSS